MCGGVHCLRAHSLRMTRMSGFLISSSKHALMISAMPRTCVHEPAPASGNWRAWSRHDHATLHARFAFNLQARVACECGCNARLRRPRAAQRGSQLRSFRAQLPRMLPPADRESVDRLVRQASRRHGAAELCWQTGDLVLIRTSFSKRSGLSFSLSL